MGCRTTLYFPRRWPTKGVRRTLCFAAFWPIGCEPPGFYSFAVQCVALCFTQVLTNGMYEALNFTACLANGMCYRGRANGLQKHPAFYSFCEPWDVQSPLKLQGFGRMGCTKLCLLQLLWLPNRSYSFAGSRFSFGRNSKKHSITAGTPHCALNA